MKSDANVSDSAPVKSVKYPIMLVHGLGCRDFKHLNYWGRIPDALQNAGAAVFHGNQDSFGSIESNAEQLKDRLEHVLEETGAEKVNIIAHSKGGLDSRYMISVLGMGDKVASLTTVATPHRGSVTVDKLMRLPRVLIRTAAFFSDIFFRLLGDKSPDSYKSYNQLTTRFASEFNELAPDCGGVYYQSCAFALGGIRSEILLMLPYIAVKLIEGENDGIITVTSATWTNFRGVFRSPVNRGISHLDEVDMRRRRFTKTEKDGYVSDITLFYIDIIRDLARMGF